MPVVDVRQTEWTDAMVLTMTATVSPMRSQIAPRGIAVLKASAAHHVLPMNVPMDNCVEKASVLTAVASCNVKRTKRASKAPVLTHVRMSHAVRMRSVPMDSVAQTIVRERAVHLGNSVLHPIAWKTLALVYPVRPISSVGMVSASIHAP